MHRIGYLAVKAHWPTASIFSKTYIDLQGEYDELLNINPKYSSQFLVIDKNAPKEDQVVNVWTIFSVWNKEDPNSGIIKISESTMRNIVSDFYLYSNLTLKSGFCSKPKVRIIFVIKCISERGKQILFSRLVKMSDLVTWNGVGDMSFESPKLSELYASKFNTENALDPRPVFPGHFYNLLRSYDYVVKTETTGKDTVYFYPFDFINPIDRVSKKNEPEYLYSAAKNMFYGHDAIVTANQALTREELFITVGVIKSAEGKKTLQAVVRSDTDILEMNNILHTVNPEDPVAYMKKNHPDFHLYPDYTWYLNTPLSKAAKGLR